jgi:hypothetical protein
MFTSKSSRLGQLFATIVRRRRSRRSTVRKKLSAKSDSTSRGPPHFDTANATPRSSKSYAESFNDKESATETRSPTQAGISDFGNKDNIVNNKISGAGYTQLNAPAGTTYALIDTSGSQAAHVNNNK